jgi:catechol 2,3-dioxygenase-like lactoylglutathione lyase family enzyme
MPPIKGIAHVELSVRDLDASVAWYCRLLGARDVFRNRDDERGFSACAILEPASRTVLAFTRHDALEDGAFAPQRVGLDHVSFAVPDLAALEAWLTHLDALGIEHDALDDQGFAVALNLRDPDGIALEFYFLRPREER